MADLPISAHSNDTKDSITIWMCALIRTYVLHTRPSVVRSHVLQQIVCVQSEDESSFRTFSTVVSARCCHSRVLADESQHAVGVAFSSGNRGEEKAGAPDQVTLRFKA